MRLNQRGEAITIGIVTAGVIIGLLGFVVGTSGVRKWIPGFGGSDNKTKQVSKTHVESKPIFVKGQDGKEYVLQQTTTTTSTSDVSEEQQMSLIQRILVLPKLWVMLMILGIFCPPVAIVMGIINRKLFGEAKKIVGGVEDSLKAIDSKSVPGDIIAKLQAGTPLTPTEIQLVVSRQNTKEVVLDTLSKRFDSSTKKLVSNIKRTI